MAFNILQRLQWIDEEVEAINERIVLLREDQEREHVSDVQYTGAIVVLVICVAVILLVVFSQ